MMKLLIPIIFAIFMIQSCSDNYTNNPDNEEQVSESELEFNNEIDFIYDDGTDDNSDSEENNGSSDDDDSDGNLTSV